jgi:hypothetical protein
MARHEGRCQKNGPNWHMRKASRGRSRRLMVRVGKARALEGYAGLVGSDLDLRQALRPLEYGYVASSLLTLRHIKRVAAFDI